MKQQCQHGRYNECPICYEDKKKSTVALTILSIMALLSFVGVATAPQVTATTLITDTGIQTSGVNNSWPAVTIATDGSGNFNCYPGTDCLPIYTAAYNNLSGVGTIAWKDGNYSFNGTIVATQTITFAGSDYRNVNLVELMPGMNLVNASGKSFTSKGITYDGRGLSPSVLWVQNLNKLTLTQNHFTNQSGDILVHLYTGINYAWIEDNLFDRPSTLGDLLATAISNYAVISGNIFDRTQGFAGAGVTSGGAANYVVTHNVVLGNNGTGGITLENDYGGNYNQAVITANILNGADLLIGKPNGTLPITNTLIANNELQYGSIKILGQQSNLSLITGVSIINNNIIQAWQAGISIQYASGIITRGNNIYDCNINNNSINFDKGCMYLSFLNNSLVSDNELTMNANGTYMNPFGIKYSNVTNTRSQNNVVNNNLGSVSSYVYVGNTSGLTVFNNKGDTAAPNYLDGALAIGTPQYLSYNITNAGNYVQFGNTLFFDQTGINLYNLNSYFDFQNSAGGNSGGLAVGIGISGAPTQKLDVNGSINATGNVYVGNSIVCLNNGSNCPAGASNNAGWLNTTAQVTLANNQTNLSINNSELFVDTADSRVGILTTTPNANLQVNGDINASTVNIGTAKIANYPLAVAGSITMTSGGSFYSRNNNNLTLYVDASPSAAILFKDSGGGNTFKMAIGTSTPTQLLSVGGNANITGNLTTGGYIYPGPCNGGYNAGAVCYNGTSNHLCVYNGSSLNNTMGGAC